MPELWQFTYFRRRLAGLCFDPYLSVCFFFLLARLLKKLWAIFVKFGE